MADRSVTVVLKANVKPYLVALAQAEAAAKRFRDGLGKGMPDPFEPWDQEQKQRRQQAPKDGEQLAGAFARSFSRHLETAFRSLPKVKIDSDASAAQTKLQSIRSELEMLSAKQIGIDVEAGDALAQFARLHRELEQIDGTADVDVRADITAALAQLQIVQREVDKFADPRITPDVDASRAEAELDELRRRMADLSSRDVRIDLDAGAAKAELSAIQRDLERLNATSVDAQVRVDSAAALAELRAVQSALNSTNNKRARVKVDADVGGALTAIAAVGAALAALPSVATIGVGAAGIATTFAAAGAGAAGFAAVAVPSLGRINEALKEQQSAAGGAGGAVKSAAQSAADAAQRSLALAEAQDRVTDAADRVKQAQQSVRDALSSVSRAKADVARAAEDAAARQTQAASRIADAERSVQDAHRATQRAVEDLTRARERAQERIEDLALATEGGALSEERALLSIRRAQADLARVNTDPKASSLDRDDAALRLKEAEFNLKRIRESNGDLAKEQAESNQKGIEGSDEVVAAKERILQAQQREVDAERALGQARAEAARAARDGALQVAEAQARVGDAQQKILEAQKEYARAQRDAERATQRLKVEQLQQKAAMEQAAGAAGGGGGAASKMAELSKAERDLAKDVRAFTDEYVAWQRSLQPDVFPVIRAGMDTISVGMDRATPLVKGGAKGLLAFAAASKQALESRQWVRFFDDLGEKAPRAISGLGNATINVAGGLAGIIKAFLPYTDDLSTWLENVTQDFENWGQSLDSSPKFREFLDYVQTNGPKAAEVMGNIATFAGKVLTVSAEAGSGVLDFLIPLSEKLATMDPTQIEAVAKGVGLVFAAAKLGATIKIGGLVLLADVLSKMSPGQIEALAIALAGAVVAVKGYQAVSGAVGWWQSLSGGIDKAGKSADGANGKLSKLGDLLGSGLGQAAGAGVLLYGVAAGADALNDAVSGLNVDIDKLTGAIVDYGRNGKAAPELLNQTERATTSFRHALVPTIGDMENFGESARRLSSDNMLEQWGNTAFSWLDDSLGLSLDQGAQRIDNLDQALAKAVSSGNAAEAARTFGQLAKQAQEANVPTEKLKDLFPAYTKSMEGAIPTTGEMASAMGLLKLEVDPLEVAMKSFNDSLAVFNANTDAAQRTLELKDAFAAAKKAIAESTTGLDLNRAKTDEQKEAVIRARDAFGGYIEKVLASAKAAGEAAGKQGEMALKSEEARNAFVQQIPQLFTLAGKSGEAREQVYKLAEGFGVNRAQADKAKQGVEGAQKVISELKGKKVDVGVDTGKGMESIAALKREIAQLTAMNVVLTINAAATTAANAGKSKKAQGGIERYAAGGIRMASGGYPSAARPQPPHLANKPTVLYGEGSSGRGATEAYIPYEAKYRNRAVGLLGDVAADFGLRVQPARQPVSSRMSTGRSTYRSPAADTASMGEFGSSQVSGPGGTVINVDLSGSTIRDPVDVRKVSSEFGYELGLRAPALS